MYIKKPHLRALATDIQQFNETNDYGDLNRKKNITPQNKQLRIEDAYKYKKVLTVANYYIQNHYNSPKISI